MEQIFLKKRLIFCRRKKYQRCLRKQLFVIYLLFSKMCHFPPRKRQHSVDSGRAIRASHASTFSSLDFVKFLLPDTGVDFRGNSPTRRISSVSFSPLKMHISTTLSLTSHAVLEISAKSAGAAFSRGATLSRQLCLFEYVADCRRACLLVERMHPLTLNSPPVPTRSTNTYTIQSLRSKRF